MKLLLTSNGLSNESIKKELEKLLGKSLKGTRIAVIPTASNMKSSSKNRLVLDMYRFVEAGMEVDIVDISALDKEIFIQRLELADIILFGGGNTWYLMDWIIKSGLIENLTTLLEDKIYMGISAGSIIAGSTLFLSSSNLFDENKNHNVREGLCYVDFQFIPHLNSEHFPKIRKENIQKSLVQNLNKDIYMCDDETTISVDNGEIKIVSEGEYYMIKSDS